MQPELKIDWATHKAAKYACENWHYSKCLPSGKTVKLGVWEDNNFIGIKREDSKEMINSKTTGLPSNLTTNVGSNLTTSISSKNSM